MALLALALACRTEGHARSGVAEATFWYSYGGRNREVLEDLLGRFNRERGQSGRLRGTFQGDYFEALAKLRAALVGRRAPALTHVVAEAVPSLADAGVLEDLGPLARGPEGIPLEDLVPALSQAGTFTGAPARVFAIPFNRSTPILYFNRRLLADAGISPPATWDELRVAARALTRREEDRTTRFGLTCPLSWWFWYAALHEAGGRLLTPDGRRAAFAGPEGVAALRLYLDMSHEGTLRLPPGRDFAAWESAHADFLGERAAMLVTSTAFLSYLTDNAHFEIGAAQLPAGVVRAAPTGGTFFVIPKSAPASEKRIAWAFVRWMTAPERTAEWSRRTGYLPVRRSAAESDAMKALYRERPNFRVALDQLDRPARFPWSPALLAIEREIVQPAIERVASGRETPEVALARAARAANARLAEYR